MLLTNNYSFSTVGSNLPRMLAGLTDSPTQGYATAFRRVIHALGANTRATFFLWKLALCVKMTNDHDQHPCKTTSYNTFLVFLVHMSLTNVQYLVIILRDIFVYVPNG